MEKPHSHQSVWLFSLIILTAYGLCGAAVYWLYALNWLGISLSLAAGTLLLWQAKRYQLWSWPHCHWVKLSRRESWQAGLFLGVWLLAWRMLQLSASDAPMISPWQQVSGWFLPVWLGLWLWGLKLANGKHPWQLALLRLHYFLSFSVAAVIYKLGYGFDPFIHQAAIEYIVDHGFVLPKTIYYAGQYSLITILHQLSRLPVAWLNTWLVPGLAAWLLPGLFQQASDQLFHHESAKRTLLWLLLLLPVSLFIITTPQNLGYLFAIAAILLMIGPYRRTHVFAASLSAAFALSCQPIAGLPALIFIASLSLRQRLWPKKDLLYASLFAANALGLPMAFYFLENSRLPWWRFLVNIIEANNWPLWRLANSEHWLLNSAYIYGFNLFWLLALLTAGGAIFLFKNAQAKHLGLYLICLGQAFALLIAQALSRGLEFGYLINYERGNYADRLNVMAAISLLPIIIVFLYELAKRALSKKWSANWRMLFAVMAGLTALAGLYYSYPRKDDLHNTRGWSTAAADLAAAQAIADRGGDYIVLANQQVSAAALKRFGFAKYYNGLFYYPIPTGGQLYEFFLIMNEKPTRAAAQAAMDITGTPRLYYIVNRYWWASEKIIAEAKLSADGWWSEGDGQVTVFYYDRDSKKDSSSRQ